jgi:hypothetical protein
VASLSFEASTCHRTPPGHGLFPPCDQHPPFEGIPQRFRCGTVSGIIVFEGLRETERERNSRIIASWLHGKRMIVSASHGCTKYDMAFSNESSQVFVVPSLPRLT